MTWCPSGRGSAEFGWDCTHPRVWLEEEDLPPRWLTHTAGELELLARISVPRHKVACVPSQCGGWIPVLSVLILQSLIESTQQASLNPHNFLEGQQ